MTRKPRTHGNGAGSVYHRGKRWCAEFTLRWEDGKPVRWRGSFPTSREAHAALAGAIDDAAEGELHIGASTTVARYLDAWLADHIQPHRAYGTYCAYRTLVRVHLAPLIGTLRLRDVTPADVQRILAEATRVGLAANTVRHLAVCLSSAFGHAVKLELLTRNPAARAERPGETEEERPTLTPAQADLLLTRARGTRFEPAYALALLAALRIGEVLGLRWSDVDLAGETLYIRQQAVHAVGGVTTKPPKSRAGRRAIPMAGRLVEILARLPRPTPEALLCPAVRGGLCSAKELRRGFYGLLSDAGLPRLHFHDLRHSCASYLISEGVHPKTLQVVLGHSSIRVTLDIYGHLLPAAGGEAIRRLDHLFPVRGSAAGVDSKSGLARDAAG